MIDHLSALVAMRGHEIAKLQQRIYYQRRDNRKLKHEAIVMTAKLRAIEADLSQTERELAAAKEQITKLVGTNQILRQRCADLILEKGEV